MTVSGPIDDILIDVRGLRIGEGHAFFHPARWPCEGAAFSHFGQLRAVIDAHGFSGRRLKCPHLETMTIENLDEIRQQIFLLGIRRAKARPSAPAAAAAKSRGCRC